MPASTARSHWLTEDIQDYVAYLSVLVAGACPKKHSGNDVEKLRHLGFCDWCESHAERMPAGLLAATVSPRGPGPTDPTPSNPSAEMSFGDNRADGRAPDDADASLSE